jgi:serine/threonine protein phosphatase PrpC
MWQRPETRFDAACALSLGARGGQEDAVLIDFPVGTDTGFAVLADGMGGHSAGDIASRQTVSHLYATLKLNSEAFADHTAELPRLLKEGLSNANDAVRDHIRQHPRLHGMGTTLVCLAIVEGRAHWISVGDSPLYLLRNGELKQLNQNHSVAHDIDLMVKSGAMDAETARFHPDRNCLTSAITGGQIAQVDCPEDAFELRSGDMLLAASDGLQFLDIGQITRILTRYRRRSAAEIAGHLLSAIDALADPDQDNTSLSLIKVNHVRPTMRQAPVSKPTFKSRRSRESHTLMDATAVQSLLT